MKRQLFWLALLASIGLSLAEGRTEFADAAQPQLAVADNGTVWLVCGKSGAVMVAESKDAGATFSEPREIAKVPNLLLGMRRGPRIAAHGSQVTVTVIGDELFSYSSADAGKTWKGPTTINGVPASAHEGLHDLAVAGDGHLFVTWLDMRNGAMQLWGAESADAGISWTKNQLVYQSPEKSICECCHPSALFDNEGNLAVMWRNSLSGSRDLWMAVRPKGANQFSAAKKLGTGTWTLNACPMDGGRIVALGQGKFASVWQRAGEIYFCQLDGSEILMGKGKQPVALVREKETHVLWQNGAELVEAVVGRGDASVVRASGARFPVVIGLPANRGALLAYEVGAATEHADRAPAGTEHGGKRKPAEPLKIVIERF